jgi:hypothetical protein
MYEYTVLSYSRCFPVERDINDLAEQGWRVVSAGGGGDVSHTFVIMERKIS